MQVFRLQAVVDPEVLATPPTWHAAAQSHGPCAELAHLLDRSIVTNLGGARGGGSPESKLLNLRGE